MTFELLARKARRWLSVALGHQIIVARRRWSRRPSTEGSADTRPTALAGRSETSLSELVTDLIGRIDVSERGDRPIPPVASAPLFVVRSWWAWGPARHPISERDDGEEGDAHEGEDDDEAVAEVDVERSREDLICPWTHDSLAASSPERLAALERGKCFGQALRPRVFAFG